MGFLRKSPQQGFSPFFPSHSCLSPNPLRKYKLSMARPSLHLIYPPLHSKYQHRRDNTGPSEAVRMVTNWVPTKQMLLCIPIQLMSVPMRTKAGLGKGGRKWSWPSSWGLGERQLLNAAVGTSGGEEWGGDHRPVRQGGVTLAMLLALQDWGR